MSETVTTGHTYTLTRVLDAPVDKVWAAWTQPEHYAAWSGALLPSLSLDVRPGGAWRATMGLPDGSEFALTGTYGEVVENRRLEVIMDLPGGAATAMAVELTDLDGKTEIVVSQTCATAQERDDSEEGSGYLLDGLSAYVPTI